MHFKILLTQGFSFLLHIRNFILVPNIALSLGSNACMDCSFDLHLQERLESFHVHHLSDSSQCLPLLSLSPFRMDDGRLLDYLMNHDELMEEKVAFYIRDIMEALQYLHNCRVAHLDIKVVRKRCPGSRKPGPTFQSLP